MSPHPENPEKTSATQAKLESPSAAEELIKVLARKLEDALPQTQCTKCGFDGCRPYAEAMAKNEVPHNQCPPGGAAGIERLATILQRAILPLNPDNGVEAPRRIAVIDANTCIGCTLCIQACPTDAIVGAAKQLHSIIADHCTGCDLCVPPCPVDCIAMVPVSENRTGWAAWSQTQADTARARYWRRASRRERVEHEKELILMAKAQTKFAEVAALTPTNDAEAVEKNRKQKIIAAALARVKQGNQQAAQASSQTSPAELGDLLPAQSVKASPPSDNQ